MIDHKPAGHNAKAPPWVPLYASDFLADVGHLGNTELGIYWRLLLVYYRDARPLPGDTDRLRRLSMALTPEEHRALETVLLEFFAPAALPDGSRVWRHKRADEVLGVSESRIEAKREGAAKARAIKEAKRRAAEEEAAQRAAEEAAMLTAEQTSTLMSELTSGTQPQPQPQPQTTLLSKGSQRAPKGARLQGDKPLPDAWAEWAQRECPAIAPLDTFERFRDYWIAQPGQRGVKLDWFATWRNWCKTELERKQQRSTPNRGGADDAAPAWVKDRKARADAFYGPAAASRAKARVSPNPTTVEIDDHGAPRLLD